MTNRTVARKVKATAQLEGGGFLVHRPFPTPAMDHFDPFLLLDEMGPVEHGPGEAIGAPDHPHRGFETVTYLLSGEMQHKDSKGRAGKLTPGDVQWMTAGSGVIHSEMPTPEFQKSGGRMHGFQLWVNLPSVDKMMAPRYQEISNAEIPVGKSDDGKVSVRVIAGESLATKAVIETRTPIMYLDITLAAGGTLDQVVPQNYNAFLYVVDGDLTVSGISATRSDAVFLNDDGDSVTLASLGGARVLLIGGQPLREPVARYGPFVMNSREEIYQAVEDYQQGRFGEIS
jgi:redox-sensitive bicupin YhaK (pirin superfamily)